MQVLHTGHLWEEACTQREDRQEAGDCVKRSQDRGRLPERCKIIRCWYWKTTAEIITLHWTKNCTTSPDIANASDNQWAIPDYKKEREPSAMGFSLFFVPFTRQHGIRKKRSATSGQAGRIHDEPWVYSRPAVSMMKGEFRRGGHLGW